MDNRKVYFKNLTGQVEPIRLERMQKHLRPAAHRRLEPHFKISLRPQEEREVTGYWKISAEEVLEVLGHNPLVSAKVKAGKIRVRIDGANAPKAIFKSEKPESVSVPAPAAKPEPAPATQEAQAPVPAKAEELEAEDESEDEESKGSEGSIDMDALASKPLDRMSKNELLAYAELHKIEVNPRARAFNVLKSIRAAEEQRAEKGQKS